MEKPKGPGGCFKAVLVAAGFDCTELNIPEWATNEDRQRIYRELGLEPYPVGTVFLDGNRWYITVTVVAPGKGHAQLMVGSRVPPHVLGLTPLPPETVITKDLVQARLTRAGLARRVNWF